MPANGFRNGLRNGTSKISLQLIFGLLAIATMIVMTLLTAHYKSYGPLEIIASVKKSNRSIFSKPQQAVINDDDHLQLVNGLQSYSVPDVIHTSRPNSIHCSSVPVEVRKYMLANVNASIAGNFACSFKLNGFLVPTSKPISLVSSVVQTGLVYSFSNDILEDVKGEFSEWEGDIFPIGAAFAIKKNELALVSRIWLNKERHFITRSPGNFSAAEQAMFDNYFYKSSYDLNMKKLTRGSLLKLNIPNVKKAKSGDGPMDPKIFFLNERLHVMFNAAVADKLTRKWHDRMFIFLPDLGPDAVFMLNIANFTLAPRDKGWTPLISADNQLYFVYRYDPYAIMQCDPSDFSKPCTMMTPRDEKMGNGQQFPDKSFHLRGGSPFVEYMHPYYVSIGHSTFFTKSGTRFYTTNIMLLNFQSQKLVYISSDLSFSWDLLKYTTVARPWVVSYPFFFSLGIHVSNPDELLVSGHFNDAMAALIRVSGVRAIFDAAIAADLESVGSKSQGRKPVENGKLNALLLRQVANETGLVLEASH